ncbi:hypothetical protein SteCoe_4441 [Stentor coeruleus]|uniref:Centromere protein J C-terminal domain-containing protein n=1 Tax=Stentor coeruleus TaxID=5963 RepID=A0A1R2CUQ7_9CILI|nr:hypothetical protein SteCoe_4441 [Stentor coeruleus]
MLYFSPSNYKSNTPSPPLTIPKAHDEIPVKKSTKTFEELVEEELRKTSDFEDIHLKTIKPPSAYYLKRGQGTLCTHPRPLTPSNPTFASTLKKNLLPSHSPDQNFHSKSVNKMPTKIISKSAHKKQDDFKQIEGIEEIEVQKTAFKPLDLYRIRRDKWKKTPDRERETRFKDEENFISSLGFQGKEPPATTRINSQGAEKKSNFVKKIKEIQELARDKEEMYKKQIEEYKIQLEEFKKENTRLRHENYILKQQKYTNATNTKIPTKTNHDLKNLAEEVAQEVVYSNGTTKKYFKNGLIVTYYPNKDIKQEFSDGKTTYFFAEPQTTQVLHKNGIKELKFITGQEEIHYPDGKKEIKYPDNTMKIITSVGDEKIIFPDGTTQLIKSSKLKCS